MVAIVILRREEADIALYGSLPEPGFRPFPGSALERELEEEWERERLGYNAEEDDEEDERSVEETPAEQFTPILTARTLPRLGPASVWKRSAREIALLATQRGEALGVIGLGTVEGGSRAPFRGVRNIDVRVRYLLRVPISISSVHAALTRREQTLLAETLTGPLRPLSPTLGRSVMTALIEQHPDLKTVFRDIRDQTNAELLALVRSRRLRQTELAREATSSALHFFAAAWHTLRPEAAPSPSEFAHQLEALSGATENDVITDDAGVFPGWDRAAYSRGGWWEFHSKGRRLLVKNINVSPQESRTGADLVYVRRNPDSFVLVQYKLLQSLQDGRLVFRPDGRLYSQVERMLQFENNPRGNVAVDDADTYRIGRAFSFVKFVEPAAVRAERPGELMPGYYLPSEFVRRLLVSPDAGPHGGVVYFISDHRHINPDTFARLVRDTWVGSTGNATSLLRDLFGLRDSDVDLVLAIEEPIDTGPSE